MQPSSSVNPCSTTQNVHYEIDDPMTLREGMGDYDEALDFSFGNNNMLSQNDVGWGSPLEISKAKEAAAERKRKRLANRPVNYQVNTPLRVMRRYSSSPALGDSKRRSGAKRKPDEVKNLNDIFEDIYENGDNASQDLVFDLTTDDNDIPEETATVNCDTSMDDFLMTLPLDEIEKAAKAGAKRVNVEFDPLVGSSQIVRTEQITTAAPAQQRQPPKSFVRHTSLPVSPAVKSPEEDLTQKRRCTPEEIAAKRQAALEKLKKSRGNVILQQQSAQSAISQAKTAVDVTANSSTSATTTVNLSQSMKAKIEANKRRALELREMKRKQNRT